MQNARQASSGVSGTGLTDQRIAGIGLRVSRSRDQAPANLSLQCPMNMVVRRGQWLFTWRDGAGTAALASIDARVRSLGARSEDKLVGGIFLLREIAGVVAERHILLLGKGRAAITPPVGEASVGFGFPSFTFHDQRSCPRKGALRQGRSASGASSASPDCCVPRRRQAAQVNKGVYRLEVVEDALFAMMATVFASRWAGAVSSLQNRACFQYETRHAGTKV